MADQLNPLFLASLAVLAFRPFLSSSNQQPFVIQFAGTAALASAERGPYKKNQ